MNLLRKNFIALNEGFTCEACQFAVPPAPGTFRNHCPACLYSKHVDALVPGDRAATCGGLMPTVALEGSDLETLDLVQQCEGCGKINRNRRASDDRYEIILRVIRRSQEP